jgi:hypothetical protein
MQAEAEQRWERALETPLEGVQFTYEEFADALSKYDFSFEIGDTVISSSTGSPYFVDHLSFCNNMMLHVHFLTAFWFLASHLQPACGILFLQNPRDVL